MINGNLLSNKAVRIIDISQPVDSTTACFPGDTPFSRNVTVTFEESKSFNLTALTMSPHVGTHADSPVHVRGTMSHNFDTAGQMPLDPFIGPVFVVDIAPLRGAINAEDVDSKLPDELPERVLFRTCEKIRYQVFEDEYSYFTPGLVDYMAMRGVKLIGIDTPSVDKIDSKTLDAHTKLLDREIFWLENLDLTQVRGGTYFLVALPLKFMELEASPVRAILLDSSQ